MKSCVVFSALAVAVSAKTVLLVPYYISPYTWKADWDALISTIDKHPALDFHVIVNNGNGPPYNSSLAEPGSPTPRDLIDWADHLGQNWGGVDQDISIRGIFFDEINTDHAQLRRNLDLTRYAKSVVGGGLVVLNPGVAVQPGSETLFDAANSILKLETCYTKDHDQAARWYRAPLPSRLDTFYKREPQQPAQQQQPGGPVFSRNP
ncbi:Spherulation-specific family 4 [Akanthomyces lecanii RCEF 1005]|uniref:Spherulation-specific family 4 n=1 Tax=Akanthomyces lecanii RCEF 1005 TaxID=1081108 RepID=A0A168GYY1_CORDF|nr:Spherulation-specific family 4 [Akanthomyces lecanii RCEF 1005]